MLSAPWFCVQLGFIYKPAAGKVAEADVVLAAGLDSVAVESGMQIRMLTE